MRMDLLKKAAQSGADIRIGLSKTVAMPLTGLIPIFKISSFSGTSRPITPKFGTR